MLDHLLSQFTLVSAQGQTLDKNLHHGDRERMHNVHWTSHLMTFCWYLRRWDWNLCSTNIVWVLVLVTIFCTRKIPRQSSIECVCARWCQSFRICIEISPMLENHWIFTTSVSERKPSKSDKIWFILLRPDWTVSHQGLNWLVGKWPFEFTYLYFSYCVWKELKPYFCSKAFIIQFIMKRKWVNTKNE